MLTRSLKMNSKKNNFSRSNLIFFGEIRTELLKRKIPSARYEAEELLKHFGKMSRLELFSGEKPVSRRGQDLAKKAVRARLSGKPLGHILKETEFCGLKFFLDANVLIPRPETEILAEESLNVLNQNYSGKTADVLDVGTGSGVLAVCLTLKRPGCRMTALELSEKALCIARKNINLHGLDKHIRLVKSDLFKVFGTQKKAFWDIIVSNPPYVPKEDFAGLSKEVRSEPFLALNGGPKGLQIIKRILKEAPHFLKKNGWLLMEIGDGQSKLVRRELKTDKNFKDLRFVKDFSGVERILIVRKQ